MSERDVRQKAFRESGSSPLDELIFRLRARRILNRFPVRAEVVADLGSGHDYRLVRHLLRSGRAEQGIAVDLSLHHRSDANIRLIEADLGKPLAIDDRSVDVVLSLAVVEHLDEPALHLGEGHRILRPGGTLLLTSPAPASRRLLEFLAYRLHVIDEHEIRDHRHYFDERELRALLVDAGFDASLITYQRFLLGLNQFVTAIR